MGFGSTRNLPSRSRAISNATRSKRPLFDPNLGFSNCFSTLIGGHKLSHSFLGSRNHAIASPNFRNFWTRAVYSPHQTWEGFWKENGKICAGKGAPVYIISGRRLSVLHEIDGRLIAKNATKLDQTFRDILWKFFRIALPSKMSFEEFKYELVKPGLVHYVKVFNRSVVKVYLKSSPIRSTLLNDINEALRCDVGRDGYYFTINYARGFLDRLKEVERELGVMIPAVHVINCGRYAILSMIFILLLGLLTSVLGALGIYYMETNSPVGGDANTDIEV